MHAAVAPHCDTLLAAFCGMAFRAIEAAMRAVKQLGGIVDLARKGVVVVVTMASSHW